MSGDEGKKRILISLLIGFSSGLPLTLSASTLQAWYTQSNVSLKEIGLMGLAGLPYTLKFIWAPLMDRWVPPFLGRRRGWMLLCQLWLCLALISMAFFTPLTHPKILFLLACLVAFFSASQDIAIDAYRVDMLRPEERPLGAAMGTNGYRMAMLVSGGLALIIADYWGWRSAYLAMAGCMSIGIIAALIGPNPELEVIPPKCIWDCTMLPLIDFLKRRQSIWILLFIVFYKLGDAFAGAINQTFLLRGVGLSLSEVGVMAKSLGFLGTIFGTTLGAVGVVKWGWFRALLIFGVVQAVSNLLYMPLIWIGAHYVVAGFALFIENLCGGMGTAAFSGLLMGLCNARFTAFQFTLLSCLSAVGRVLVGPLAGVVAYEYGWILYFIASLVLSLPGLLLLIVLKSGIAKMTEAILEDRKTIELTPAIG